ncbi:hypothetical protein AB1Y20_018738 [Prymnesium parvum]|uniref:Chromo domain-containing protein n=1 Tax=Prymnesium parvum TaxID=97485 RepID=A0AB34JT64_PRYPA
MGGAGSGKGKRKPAQGGAPTLMRAEGTGTKRTPASAFDPAAGKGMYEPELIVAERLARGVTQFQVKWKGYEARHNTWEPIEHLAGCEDMIVDFKKRATERIKELEQAAAEKRAQKQAALAEKLASDATAAAADRAEKRAAGTAAEKVVFEEIIDELRAVPGPAKRTRRTSVWWQFFDERGCKENYATCKLERDGKLCETSICHAIGASLHF